MGACCTLVIESHNHEHAYTWEMKVFNQRRQPSWSFPQSICSSSVHFCQLPMFPNGHPGSKHQRVQKNTSKKTLTVINSTIILYNVFLGVVWCGRYYLWDIYPSLGSTIILWEQLENDESKTEVDVTPLLQDWYLKFYRARRVEKQLCHPRNNYIILSPCGIYTVWVPGFMHVPESAKCKHY